MLDTLLKIGEWQSQGKSVWDRFLDKPKIDSVDKKGNSITGHVLPVIFDLDAMDVVIDTRGKREYDDALLEPLKALKIQGGNNKAIYVTVPSAKVVQLYKTFFGKEGADAAEGEIAEAIRKEDPALLTDSFKSLLANIFLLRDIFFQKMSVVNEKKGVREISFKAIEDQVSLSKHETIAFVYVQVKASKFGIDKPHSFAELPAYLDFLKRKFLGSEESIVVGDARGGGAMRMCYASGQMAEDVDALDLSSRYSLNKMFVKETKNYASQFDENSFRINYQVSKQHQEKLDYASNYLLNEGSFKVRIANIDHVIIPQFLAREQLDWDLALGGIKAKADILFHFDTLEDAVKNIQMETTAVFWINFLAYESDGNFFKSTEVIKDVSSFHFQKIIDSFTETHWEFKAADYVDWSSVMTEYGKHGKMLNFNTLYALIPLRKDKEKKNKALDLFKAILENRRVAKYTIFRYFGELIRCHYYERYGSYTNISKSSKDYFGKSVRDSVFKYHAFIQVLKKLNLIDMEDSMQDQTTPSDVSSPWGQAIDDFFKKMQLTQEQQAMFYLGRMLNAVEFMQQGKKKTVIGKVDFNGMDKDDILRLRNALVEKSKQYGKVGKIIFADRNFGETFDFNNWRLDPNEAVFFLLTGYSFYISKQTAEELEETEDTTTIEN